MLFFVVVVFFVFVFFYLFFVCFLLLFFFCFVLFLTPFRKRVTMKTPVTKMLLFFFDNLI